MATTTSYTDRVAAYFQAHPHEWIDGRQLAQIGGAYAWRSRVSDARRQGLNIVNRCRRVRVQHLGFEDAWTVSEYKYEPADV